MLLTGRMANFNGFVNRIMEGEADYVNIHKVANGVEFHIIEG